MASLKLRLASLTSNTARLQAQVQQRVGARNLLLQQAEQQRSDIGNIHEDMSLAQKSLRVLQAAAETLRGRMKTSLESIATKVLQYVFDNPTYEVRIDVEVKHNLVYASVMVSKDGILSQIEEGHGGGVSDVLAYVFRASVLRAQTGLAQILVFDEPLKFLNSQDAASRMGVLMNHLAAKGVQQIVISSKNDLADSKGRHFTFTRLVDDVIVKVEDRGDD